MLCISKIGIYNTLCLWNFSSGICRLGAPTLFGDKMKILVDFCVVLSVPVVGLDCVKEYRPPWYLTKGAQRRQFLPKVGEKINVVNKAITAVVINVAEISLGKMAVVCQIDNMKATKKLRTKGWKLEGPIGSDASDTEAMYQQHLDWAQNGYSEKKFREVGF